MFRHRGGGLHNANPPYVLLRHTLAVTVTPAQTRDVRCGTAWYDIGIAFLE
jgi:hypothetical protein